MRFCIQCNKKLKSYQKKYCSISCANMPKNLVVRGLTRDTAYLVHKWKFEGESVKNIARLLDRPVSQIREILDSPLSLREWNSILYYAKIKNAE